MHSRAALCVGALLCAVALSACPLRAAAQAYPPAWLDGELQYIYASNSLMGMSVTVVDAAGDTVYEHGVGYRNIARQTDTNANSYYRIASISKTVATLTLMTLYEEGKFQLDDDISDILGYSVRNPNFPDAPITVAAVLSHTSSLREGATYDDFLTYTYNQANPLQIPNLSELLTPGGKWYSPTLFGKQPQGYFVYCNLNFGIIGTLIERLSGVRFDVYARQALLSRLNVTASYNVADIAAWEDIATLYVTNGDGQWQADHSDYTQKPPQRNMTGYVPGTNGLVYGPQGGLVVRTRELAEVMRLLAYGGVLRGTRILNAETVQLMLNPQWVYNGTNGEPLGGMTRAYGLGVHISTLTREQDVVWPHKIMKGHTGSAYGLASNMFYDPVSRAGFTLACNGALGGYHSSDTSAFLLFEQQVQTATYKFLFGNDTSSVYDA